MDYVYWFNVFEATLWTILGIFSCVKAVKIHSRRLPLSGMGLLFFLFAGSEVVETQTGAWWNPWWLAVWKGLCIAGLVILGVNQYRWEKTTKSGSVDCD